jgi:hypothetical protein
MQASVTVHEYNLHFHTVIFWPIRVSSDRATGVHVHFDVIHSGEHIGPASY